MTNRKSSIQAALALFALTMTAASASQGSMLKARPSGLSFSENAASLNRSSEGTDAWRRLLLDRGNSEKTLGFELNGNYVHTTGVLVPRDGGRSGILKFGETQRDGSVELTAFKINPLLAEPYSTTVTAINYNGVVHAEITRKTVWQGDDRALKELMRAEVIDGVKRPVLKREEISSTYVTSRATLDGPRHVSLYLSRRTGNRNGVPDLGDVKGRIISFHAQPNSGGSDGLRVYVLNQGEVTELVFRASEHPTDSSRLVFERVSMEKLEGKALARLNLKVDTQSFPGRSNAAGPARGMAVKETGAP